MDGSSISLFMRDLRTLEDAIQPYLEGKTDVEITQKMVMNLIKSNKQLKTQLESLCGRAQQVAYLPVVSKLEQVVCDVLGIKNSKGLERLFSDALIKENYVLAETILKQLFVEGKAAYVIKQLTAMDECGRTPFVRAVKSRNLDMAKWLLAKFEGKKDADGTDLVVKQLTAVDECGKTLFARAVVSGNLNMAKWLLEASKGKKDADDADLVLKQLTAVDVYGMTTLAKAVDSRNLDMANWLLAQFEGKKDADGADLILKQLTAVDECGMITLAQAVASGNLNMAKWLLEVSKGKKDADDTDLVAKQLRAVDKNDKTHLALIVRSKNLDMAKWLLEVSKDKKAADGTDLVVKLLTAEDKYGKTPFAHAVESGNLDMAKWLLVQFEGKKNTDGTDLVVKQLTAVDKDGKNPFAVAVASGDLKVVEWLLGQFKSQTYVNSADLVLKQFTAVDEYRKTPFARAVASRNLDMAKWLLAQFEGKRDVDGANLVLKQFTAVDGCGMTPFTQAVASGDLKMAKWLLVQFEGKKDADDTDLVAKQLTAVDKNGKTTFSLAVESKNLVDMAKWLLEQFEGKEDADGYDLILKQLTAVYGGKNLRRLIDASELFPAVLASFRKSVDKLSDTLSAPFKKALGLKEMPSASEFYCTLALLEEPSKLISDQVKAWNVLRNDALELPNRRLCIRATYALKKLMADPSQLSGRLVEVLNDSGKPKAWRLMYLEIALDDNQANAKLLTSILDQCTVNFRINPVQKCLLILSLMESVSIAEKKGGDRDKLVGALHFLFDMNESRAFFKEVRNFRSALMILSGAEFNSRLDALDQRIRQIKETSEASKEITQIKDQIASKRAAPPNRANEMEIKDLSKKLQPLYQKFPKDSCRKWFKEIIRAKADVECDIDKMLENLENALAGRYPDAHITYLSTLFSAPDISAAVAKKSVSDFFKAMEQAYGPSPCWEKRYSPEFNAHIREVEKVYSGFYQKWQGLLDDTSLQERFKQIDLETINAKARSEEISLRGDFASILLGGTEIRGSCQHIEYPSQYSRGTVGYLLNGHLMLGCCDSMGRWTMRTLLRPVLLQQKNRACEVVLFLERIYPATRSAKDSLALITAAQEISSRLDVGLVSAEEGCGDIVVGELLLAGGVAPEYVDAGVGSIYEVAREFKLRKGHWLHKSTRLPAGRRKLEQFF